MTLRGILRAGALVLRPLLALAGVKSKTVAGKLPDVVEAADRALSSETDTKPPSRP